MLFIKVPTSTECDVNSSHLANYFSDQIPHANLSLNAVPIFSANSFKHIDLRHSFIHTLISLCCIHQSYHCILYHHSDFCIYDGQEKGKIQGKNIVENFLPVN